MRTIGIVILVIGLLITIFTGFRYVTKEKVAQVGPIEIAADREKSVGWSPLIGVAVMAVGGVILLAGGRKV
jgi:hypothetical protein